MLRKPSSILTHGAIATFAGLLLAAPAGLAFAQNATTGTTQDQAAADKGTSARKDLKELNKQLKSEDKEARQTTAELNKSRENLAHSQRDLQKAQAQEQHLASSERHTRKSEQQTGQKLEHAQPPSDTQTGATQPGKTEPAKPQ